MTKLTNMARIAELLQEAQTEIYIGRIPFTEAKDAHEMEAAIFGEHLFNQIFQLRETAERYSEFLLRVHNGEI